MLGIETEVLWLATDNLTWWKRKLYAKRIHCGSLYFGPSSRRGAHFSYPNQELNEKISTATSYFRYRN